MKKTAINLLSAFLVLLSFSCQKDQSILEKNEDEKTSSLDHLPRFQYKPTVFNLTSFSKESLQGVLDDRKQNTITFLRDSIWPNNAGKTTFYESTQLPAVLPETRNRLYLGAIIRGDQAVDVNNFTTIFIPANQRNRITMYANFPTDSIYRTVMPSTVQDASYLRDALKAGSGTQIQSFTYEQNQFRKVEELKKSFGANLKISTILEADFLDTLSSGNEKTRVRAEFTQENFTISIEPPIYEPFLKETVDQTPFNNMQPLIVSSVTYGRKGIFILESDSTYEMVRQTLNVALTLSAEMVGINAPETLGENFTIALQARMSNEQKAVIENSRIYTYVIGVDGQSTVRAVTGGLAGFAEVISRSGGFTPESPGVPLYYSLNYVNDFATFRNPFRVDVSNN